LDDAPIPDGHFIEQCLAALPFDYPVTLDIGVLSDGRTVLVEVNDAWAIGLYSKALDSKEYLQFLWKRWQTIC
jgi:hypothetical protein